MRKQWVTLLMALFVAIQFVDLAILDAEPALFSSKEEVRQNQTAFADMTLNCVSFCACQSLHSMWLASHDGACDQVSVADRPAVTLSRPLTALAAGPPVPPPNA